MREYKASTKRGQQLIEMGETCCWSSLRDIYGSWSEAKQQAFDRCWRKFKKDNKSTGFGVGNASKTSFTCSWYAIKDGEPIMRIETKDNSYLVWLDR